MPPKPTPKSLSTKKHLYYIFTYYCSFADRQNYNILKIQNYRRLLTDAQLVSTADQNLQLELDLLFARVKRNGSGVDFQMFLAIVPEISRLVFGEEKYEEGVRKLVAENFQALYGFIFESTDFGESIRFLSNTVYSQNCFLLLRSVSPTLYRLYLHHFDIKQTKPLNSRPLIFQSLTKFTKNFQITPQQLSKTQSFLIFNFILDSQSQAQSVYKQWFEDDGDNRHVFLYWHFVQFLFVVSVMVNRKVQGVQIPQFTRLVYFLEMMEVSVGFGKFCKTEQVNLHLIPNQKLVKELESKGMELGSISPQKKPGTNPSDSLNQKFLQNYSPLRQKFISFCLHGQTIGSSILSQKKGLDIILNLKLGLKQPQIEVYLASARKPLDFESFMLVLQRISEKEMIELDEIVGKFVEMSLDEEVEHQRLRTSRNALNLNRKQYRNCVAMVELVEKLLKAAFTAQAQPSTLSPNKKDLNTELSLISLSSYLKTIHNFELSPIYLTKQSLIEIFRQSIKKAYDFMTFAEFKDSFIIAIPYLNLGEEQEQAMQPETKMIVMFERINQSRGVGRLGRKGSYPKKEDYLVKFRQVFKQYYPEQIKPKQYSSQHFDSIIQ